MNKRQSQYCNRCGQKRRPGAKFCAHCGAQALPSSLPPTQIISPPSDLSPTSLPQNKPVSKPSPKEFQPPQPQQEYQPDYQRRPMYISRPQKDRSIALLLEIMPGLFGFLGFGWIYSGNTSTGLMWLIGVMMWNLIAAFIIVATFGVGWVCTAPVNLLCIAVSASSLNEYAKNRPDVFGP